MVFAGMATLSGFLVLVLPETNNTKLPDSLKEAQEQDKRTDEQTSSQKTEQKTSQTQENILEGSEEGTLDLSKKTRLWWNWVFRVVKMLARFRKKASWLILNRLLLIERRIW